MVKFSIFQIISYPFLPYCNRGFHQINSALYADHADVVPVEIESLCMRCEGNGVTRLLSTSVPYYKTIFIMSFECPNCGYKNNEIQSGEAVQEHGTEIVLHVLEEVDLCRQVVKSEYASIEVPELELLITANSQPGEITTVEGILERVHSGLSQDQDKRKEMDPENASKIDTFLLHLQECKSLQRTWTLKLRDPTGNCFIQNPDPQHVDPRCIVSHYHRSFEEQKLLALADDDCEEPEPAPEWKSFDDAKREILHFPTECPNCGSPAEVLMKPTDIPYFQTVIIMALSCDNCGHKSNEVKSGGSIKDHGCRLSVTIKESADLSRDVLKSDTCSMWIPELDLEVGPGAICSRFTTVEGLLSATRDQLSVQSSFFIGDSAASNERSRMEKFLQQFDEILALRRCVTLVLDDPAGNSYIQSLNAPLEDPNLRKEFYERTFEQNDELGLNDMKVTALIWAETYNEITVT
uniref:Zinc finger protein ZPR1 n=1 Tax=Angiostrongylus cantonensis TaxID=6313 RepID=A0A0K0CTZ9_ANGCA